MNLRFPAAACSLAVLLCAVAVPAAVAQPVNPLPTSRLLLEEAVPITELDLDRSLTKLCRAGRFGQQRTHLFIVRLGGYVHGAVIGGEIGRASCRERVCQDV